MASIFAATSVRLSTVDTLANIVCVYKLWRYIGVPGAINVMPLPFGTWAV